MDRSTHPLTVRIVNRFRPMRDFLAVHCFVSFALVCPLLLSPSRSAIAADTEPLAQPVPAAEGASQAADQAANQGAKTTPEGTTRPAPARPQPRTVFLNLKRFEIPFNIDTTGQRPVEVQLHVSRDGGQTWQVSASQPATAKQFLFIAPEDGDYWFATRTVDKSGQVYPAGAISPQLAVRVDTAVPEVEWETEVSAEGVISVSIWYVDKTPIGESIRLEYSIDGGRPWIPVTDLETRPTSASEHGVVASARIAPSVAWRQVTMRALVSDQAGNKTLVTRDVDLPRVAVGQLRLATTKGRPMVKPVSAPVDAAGEEILPLMGPPQANQPVAPAVPFANPYAPAPGVFAPQAIASMPPGTVPGGVIPPGTNLPQQPYYPAGAPAMPPSGYALPPDAFAGPNHFAGPNNSAGAGATNAGGFDPGLGLNPAQPQAVTRPSTPAEAMRPLEPGAPTGDPAASNAINLNPPNAAPDMVAGQNPLLPQGQPGSSPPNQNGFAPQGSIEARTVSRSSGGPVADFGGVPVRHSNSRMFSLEYEIESAGMAGINDVELWGTTDQGATWKRWGSDPDRQSPFDIETNHDGPYGYRIVVVSNTGLATPRPLAGDPADMVVVVDTVQPKVRITGAAYGQGDQTGALIIRYRIEDANLGSRPVTLAFGESVEGPWSTIAAGLANDGIYAWPADPHLPRQIFLRIDITDAAGNRAHYILDTPIDVQGLAPRARIRGFNPVTGSPSENGQGAVSEGLKSAEQPTEQRIE